MPTRVKARALKSDIIVFHEGKVYEGRPFGWEKKGIKEAIKKALSLRYFIYDEDENIVMEVKYGFILNDITIIEGEEKHTHIPIPLFTLKKDRYYLREKPREFIITSIREKSHVDLIAHGEKSLKEFSIEFKTFNEELDHVIVGLTIGLLIRRMAFYIGI